jgi:hypothetical protein
VTAVNWPPRDSSSIKIDQTLAYGENNAWMVMTALQAKPAQFGFPPLSLCVATAGPEIFQKETGLQERLSKY